MFKSLLLVQLNSVLAISFKTDKKKMKSGGSTGYIFLIILLIVVLGTTLGGLFKAICEPFAALGLTWLYFGFMGIVAFFLCFIGSVFLTQSQIYEAKDNELLLSMPIPIKYILASRVVGLLIVNYIYELIVVLPAIIIYVITQSVTASQLLVFAISILALPIFALAISLIIGWVIGYINSKMRNKNLVITTLTVILFAGYMYVCFSLQKYLSLLIQNGEAIGEAVQKALPPFFAMGKGIADGDFGQIGLFILWTLIPFMIVCVVLNKSFIKIATSKRGMKKAVYKRGEMKKNSLMGALIKKEIEHFVQKPMYMFNAGIGLPFMLMGAVYLAIKGDSIIPQLTQFGVSLETVGVFVGVCFAGLSAMVIISAPIISIEAKTLWLSQSMPIRDKDVLLSKALPHIIISLPFIIVSVTICVVTLKLSIVGALIAYLLPITFTIFNGIIGVIINLKYPKFDWINEVVAIKQGAAPILAMLVSVATIGIPLLLYIIVLDKFIPMLTYGFIVVSLFCALVLFAYRTLVTVGVRLYDGLKG